MGNANTRVEVSCSNLALPATAVRGADWRADFETLESTMQDLDCAPFEIAPTHTLIRQAAQLEKSGEAELISRTSGSVHIPLNSGKGVLRVLGLWMPAYGDSYEPMRRLQTHLPPTAPSIYYPEHLREPLTDKNSGTQVRLAQPVKHGYEHFKVKDTDDFYNKLGGVGVTGSCLDTIHCMMMGRNWRKIWSEHVKSGKVGEVHLGGDRSDLKNRDEAVAERSAKEWGEWTSRHWSRAAATESAEVMVEAIEGHQGTDPLRVIVETWPRLIPCWSGRDDIISLGRAINNAKEIARNAGAVVG